MFNLALRCFCLCTLFFANTALADHRQFELSLDELKKPSLPATVKKPEKQQPTRKTKVIHLVPVKKAGTGDKEQSVTEVKVSAQKAPVVKSPQISKPVNPVKTVHTANAGSDNIEDIILKNGLPCWFAGQVAGVLTATVDAVPLLQDFRLAPVAVSAYQGATVVTTCGLPDAEAYTVARLLEIRHLGLLNIKGTESGEAVLRKMLDSFGFSYRIEETVTGYNYLVYFDSSPATTLRLVFAH